MAQSHGVHWQRHANLLRGIVDNMKIIASDPATPPEDQTEAQRIVAETESNLQHLKEKHGVTPSAFPGI